MKNFIVVCLLVFILSLSANISSALNNLSFELLKKNETDDNIVYSPYSIYNALAMTVTGADGETKDQILSVLGLPDSVEASQVMREFNQQILSKTGSELQLENANALWLDKDLKVEMPYQETLRKDFKAEIFRSDFENDNLSAGEEINGWVKEKTHSKIPEIIDEMNSNDRLVLLNAIYFLGNWRHSFSIESTEMADFHISESSITEVPMMHLTHRFRYYEDLNLQAVKLPYSEEGFSMLLILPRGSGLSVLSKEMNDQQLQEILEKSTHRKVELTMPRFELDFKRELNEDLKLLGMPLAFSSGADFNLISKETGLCIDQVLHRAYIAVDEKGTEAAAATAVTMKFLASKPEQPVLFKADHPFLFLIIEEENGCVLFTGIVRDPS